MKSFTAKQLHENPAEVYRAANRESVVISHRHHGEFVLIAQDMAMNEIHIATGHYLDLIADRFKIDRNGQSDAELRAQLIALQPQKSEQE